MSEKEVVIASMTVNIADSWVPVKERLPERHKSVLVSFRCNTGRQVGIGEYMLTVSHGSERRDVWAVQPECDDIFTVEAWAPLPEPYMEEKG